MKLFWVQTRYTLHYVVKGSGTLHVGGKSYAVSAGEGFVLPPSVPFCYYPDEETPWAYFWFGLHASAGPLLSSLGFDLENPVYRTEDTEGLEAILMDAITQCTADTAADSFLADACFLRTLSHLSRLKREGGGRVYQKPPSGGCAIAEKLVLLIRANFENPDMTVELLCQMAHISHSYACKIFKAHKNMRLQDYLTACRLEKAEALLLEGSTAKEAAFASGYRDAIHFSKEFRRFYGSSPIAYAKSRNDK